MVKGPYVSLRMKTNPHTRVCLGEAVCCEWQLWLYERGQYSTSESPHRQPSLSSSPSRTCLTRPLTIISRSRAPVTVWRPIKCAVSRLGIYRGILCHQPCTSFQECLRVAGNERTHICESFFPRGVLLLKTSQNFTLKVRGNDRWDAGPK